MINAGKSKRSQINALKSVTDINIPTVKVGGFTEKIIVKKPKNKMTDVKMIAFPVSKMVFLIASF